MPNDEPIDEFSEDSNGFGHAIEPEFPSEAPPEPAPEPVYDITFKIHGVTRMFEAVGDQQRDDMVTQFRDEFGATDITMRAR